MEELTIEPVGALPNPSYIARAANCSRKNCCPEDPTDLSELKGYHNALNRRAGGRRSLPFYMLVQVLHREKEAGLSLVQIRLVPQKKLKRHQRATYERLQGRIMGAWRDYSNSKLNARQLLQTCSYINGPTRME